MAVSRLMESTSRPLLERGIRSPTRRRPAACPRDPDGPLIVIPNRVFHDEGSPALEILRREKRVSG
jgi:hypothetical protein